MREKNGIENRSEPHADTGGVAVVEEGTNSPGELSGIVVGLQAWGRADLSFEKQHGFVEKDEVGRVMPHRSSVKT